MHRRFIPGAGFDEWVGYNIGAGTTDRRWILQDHQNSVIGYTDVGGASTTANTYDEYGRPGPDNSGFLQYTGQFVSNRLLGVYNHRNRFYNAQIGRFMQTDPILYGDGLNLYAYVGNDPMNRVDPWGLEFTCTTDETGRTVCTENDPIIVVCKVSINGVCYSEAPWNIFIVNISEFIDINLLAIGAGIREMMCNAPTIGVGVSAGGYAGLGASANAGFSFDPKTGRAGFTTGVDVGVGVGGRGRAVFGRQATASLGTLDGVSVGVGASANVQAGPLSGGVRHEFLGTNMNAPAHERTQVSGGIGGAGASINANLSVSVGVAGQLYNPGCDQ